MVGGCHGTTIGKRLCHLLYQLHPFLHHVLCCFEKPMTMKQTLKIMTLILYLYSFLHLNFITVKLQLAAGAVIWWKGFKRKRIYLHVCTSDKCAVLIFMRSLIPNVSMLKEDWNLRNFPCFVLLYFPFRFCSYQHTQIVWTFYGLITPVCVYIKRRQNYLGMKIDTEQVWEISIDFCVWKKLPLGCHAQLWMWTPDCKHTTA